MCLVVLLALGLWKTARITSAAQEALAQGQLLRSAIGQTRQTPADLETLRGLEPRLSATAAALRAFQTELGPLSAAPRLFRRFPSSVRWVGEVPDVVMLGLPLSEAGSIFARTLDPAQLSVESQDLTALSRSLSQSAPNILAKLDAAEAAAARIEPGNLNGPLEPIAPLLSQLRSQLPTVRRWIRLTAVTGRALGFEGPRTYLILGENHHELRATGGFIGTTGVLTLDHGSVSNLDYGSSYLVDESVAAPPPPRPLARYLGLGGWYLRDANWWPDFPSSATQAEQAWTRAGRAAPDGVVAFDMTVVTALIDALGGLDIPRFGRVDGDSFERLAADQLYLNETITAAGGYHLAKAAFLTPVAQTLVARLSIASPRELLSLGALLARLADEKHIQMVAKDPAVSAAFTDNGWDGAIATTTGDSLLPIDSTVSYGDSFFFVTPRTRLEVVIDAAGGQAHQLELTYRNRYPEGSPPWMHPLMVEGTVYDPTSGRLVGQLGFWGNWLRVYLPLDVTKVRVAGLLDAPPPYVESGRRVVAGYLPIGPGQERVVRVEYERAGEGDGGTYEMLLQKQAGTECRETNFTVRWPGGVIQGYDVCPQQDLLVVLGPPKP